MAFKGPLCKESLLLLLLLLLLFQGGDWRRRHIGELHSLYHLPNIIMVIKSRRLRWVGHVARRSDFKTLIGKPTGRRPSGRLVGDERTILEWILKK